MKFVKNNIVPIAILGQLENQTSRKALRLLLQQTTALKFIVPIAIFLLTVIAFYYSEMSLNYLSAEVYTRFIRNMLFTLGHTDVEFHSSGNIPQLRRLQELLTSQSL